MSDIVIYLLEASALLIVLYGIYLLLLSKETFFTFNRYYLMSIFALSLLIPLLNSELIPVELSLFTKSVEGLGDMKISYYNALSEWSTETAQSESANLNSDKNFQLLGDLVLVILVSIYALGLIINVCRIFWTLYKISNLKKSFPKNSIDNVRVVEVSHEIAPFSFMKDVFIHTDNLKGEEFTQILAHEKAHIEQKHSIDLLLVQLLAAVLWFNPVVWWLIKSLKTTHEYIADKKMINQGYSLVEYQSLLLRQLISNNSFGLVHNFNLSFIKKRITMMKIKKSGWTGRVKVAFVLSATVILSLIFTEGNSQVEQSEKQIGLDYFARGNSTIVLYWGDKPISPQEGLSYSEIIKPENKEKLNYVIKGVTDEGFSSPHCKMQIKLGRDRKTIKQSDWMKVGKKKSIDIQDVIGLVRVKDLLLFETACVHKQRFIAIPIID